MPYLELGRIAKLQTLGLNAIKTPAHMHLICQISRRICPISGEKCLSLILPRCAIEPPKCLPTLQTSFQKLSPHPMISPWWIVQHFVRVLPYAILFHSCIPSLQEWHHFATTPLPNLVHQNRWPSSMKKYKRKNKIQQLAILAGGGEPMRIWHWARRTGMDQLQTIISDGQKPHPRRRFVSFSSSSPVGSTSSVPKWPATN